MAKSEKDRPVHEYRLGRVVGTVWYNENESGRGWHNVQIVRIYRDEQEHWQKSQSFGRDDLPLVMKVANELHTWIHQTWQEKEDASKTEVVSAEVPAAV